MKSRFIYIVFAIVLVILVSPFIRHEGIIGWITASLLLAMIPLGYAIEASHIIHPLKILAISP